MAQHSQGEIMRSALAVITYPPEEDLAGLGALINDWKLADYLDYISATQVILEAVVEELGQDSINRIIGRLRQISYEHD
jgi:hypothetical protein